MGLRCFIVFFCLYKSNISYDEMQAIKNYLINILYDNICMKVYDKKNLARNSQGFK